MNLRLIAACLISLAVGAATCPVPANAQDDSWIPDRRRAQFQNDPGYAILP